MAIGMLLRGARRKVGGPLVIPGTKLYLNARLGLTLGLGGSWADQSGNGNNVSVVSTPTLSSAAIGGKDAVNLAGGYFQNTTATLNTAGSAFTILAVAKHGNGAIFTNRRTPAYSQMLLLLLGSFYVDSDGTNNRTIPDASSETNSATNAFKATFKFNGVGNLLTVSINGTPRTVTGANLISETGTAGFFIGHNDASQDWGGLLAEIRVVDHVTTSPEDVAWDAWIASEYGL